MRYVLSETSTKFKKIVTSWIDGIIKMAELLKNFTTKNITNQINLKTFTG